MPNIRGLIGSQQKKKRESHGGNKAQDMHFMLTVWGWRPREAKWASSAFFCFFRVVSCWLLYEGDPDGMVAFYAQTYRPCLRFSASQRVNQACMRSRLWGLPTFTVGMIRWMRRAQQNMVSSRKELCSL